MKFTLGEKGLDRSWQANFPKEVKCVHCKGTARIGFVAHEALDPDDKPIVPREEPQFVCDLHKNAGKGKFWLHDCCAVAIYFCKTCLEPTAKYNQG
jgi:hypothetical protein